MENLQLFCTRIQNSPYIDVDILIYHIFSLYVFSSWLSQLITNMTLSSTQFLDKFIRGWTLASEDTLF